VYDDSYFFGGKEGYPNYLDEKDLLVAHGARYAKIISRFRNKPGSILDVGSAAGFILKGFEQNGWDCYGIEPNKTMVDYGIKELKLNITAGNLETFETDRRFDLITMIQVIGHFQDLDKAIQNAYKLLNPGGLLLVESWNMNSVMARLFGKGWHEYSPPSVVHWFSLTTLIDLFKYYNLKIVKVGIPVKYINMKHAITLIDNKTINFSWKQKFLNMLEQFIGKRKVFYPPLDLNWFLFRKAAAVV
jgi:SAM-dependent methyltransferase